MAVKTKFGYVSVCCWLTSSLFMSERERDGRGEIIFGSCVVLFLETEIIVVAASNSFESFDRHLIIIGSSAEKRVFLLQ